LLGAQQRGHLRRVPSLANDDVYFPKGKPSLGKIDSRLRRDRQGAVLDIANDADDLVIVARYESRAQPPDEACARGEMLPDRIIPGLQLARQCLVDDGDADRRRQIVVAEHATTQHLNAQRGEVALVDRVKLRSRLISLCY
jgi:hypothetical protein